MIVQPKDELRTSAAKRWVSVDFREEGRQRIVLSRYGLLARSNDRGIDVSYGQLSFVDFLSTIHHDILIIRVGMPRGHRWAQQYIVLGTPNGGHEG
jgi:hypothetical protein